MSSSEQYKIVNLLCKYVKNSKLELTKLWLPNILEEVSWTFEGLIAANKTLPTFCQSDHWG